MGMVLGDCDGSARPGSMGCETGWYGSDWVTAVARALGCTEAAAEMLMERGGRWPDGSAGGPLAVEMVQRIVALNRRDLRG